MNVSDLLNPLPTFVRTKPVAYERSHQHMNLHRLHQQHLQHQNAIGKPRSRFSEYEDNIIRRGVAQRLTWGQISDLLPHRKRATCFNRYRTLQGVRKSRKLSEANSPEMSSSLSSSPTSPVASCFSDPKTPPTSNYTQSNWFTPPIYDPSQSKYTTSSYATEISSNASDSDNNDDFPFKAQTTMTKRPHKIALPALSSYRHHPYHHRPTSSASSSTTTSNGLQPLYSL